MLGFLSRTLLRQSVYSRPAGYEDVNDAERLSQDPTFRLIGSEKTWERGAALTSRLQTFETEMLAKVGNFVGLARINRELIGKVEAFQWHYRAVLDMDSTRFRSTGSRNRAPTTTLRVHLLSPAAFVQSRRRLSGGPAAAGQRAQCRGLGETPVTRD